MLDQLWAEIGKYILASGGIVAIFFLIFTWLGQRWIENQFNKQLEIYKATQARELEEYKAKIAVLFNHITKIHEKEFEVLPDAWCKLQTAIGAVGVPASVYREYPDLQYFSETDLEELISKHSFSSTNKQDLIMASPQERNKIYQDICFWEELNNATKATSDFHNYLVYNKIILSKDLFDAFSDVDRKLLDVISNLKIGKSKRGINYDIMIKHIKASQS
jgi:hypothetical protein